MVLVKRRMVVARSRIMVVTKEERVMEAKMENKERGWKRVQVSAQLMFHAKRRRDTSCPTTEQITRYEVGRTSNSST